MTKEVTTQLSPSEVVRSAKRFFTDENAVCPAWPEEEGEGHLTLATFRSRIAISAYPDPTGAPLTKVRVSTLRPDESVGKFLAYICGSGPVHAAP